MSSTSADFVNISRPGLFEGKGCRTAHEAVIVDASELEAFLLASNELAALQVAQSDSSQLLLLLGLIYAISLELAIAVLPLVLLISRNLVIAAFRDLVITRRTSWRNCLVPQLAEDQRAQLIGALRRYDD